MIEIASYYYPGPSYNNAGLASLLYQAGARNLGVIAQMVPVGMRESGGRSGAHRTDSNPARLSGDIGLFQINSGNVPALIRAGVINSARDLLNPLSNARAALYLARPDGSGIRHNWGLGQGGWVGSSGNLPKPDYAAVQIAQSQGFRVPANNGNGSGSGSVNDALTGIGTAQNSAKAARDYLISIGIDPNNILGGTGTSASDLAGLLAGGAFTQGQADFAAQMAGFEAQQLALQQQGVQFDLAGLGAEKQYQDALAKLNLNRSTAQQSANEKMFKELGKNLSTLRDLAARGLSNSKDYYTKSQALEKDILKATRTYLGQQRGFSTEQYGLAQQAIANVVKTSAAKWSEVMRLTGNERKLAASDFRLSRATAQAKFGTARAQAMFAERVQNRQAVSDAIARGARLSRGTGQTLSEITTNRNLAIREAADTRNEQFARATQSLRERQEQIQQAFNQGLISRDEAARQTAIARSQASLEYRQRGADITRSGQQAEHQFRGAHNQNVNQYQNAQLAYQSALEDLRNRRAVGSSQYNLSRQMGGYDRDAIAALQRFNQQQYDINRGSLALTGQRYGIQGAANQAQLANTQDQLWYQYGQAFPDALPTGFGGGSSGGGTSRPRRPPRSTGISTSTGNPVYTTGGGLAFE